MAETGMKVSILASDKWGFNPKLTILANFQIFKLKIQYEVTRATKIYFVRLLLMIKYSYCEKIVWWHV